MPEPVSLPMVLCPLHLKKNFSWSSTSLQQQARSLGDRSYCLRATHQHLVVAGLTVVEPVIQSGEPRFRWASHCRCSGLAQAYHLLLAGLQRYSQNSQKQEL
ncbi:hypothetical protein Mapa_005584 [Marchantia paleacea]|nr:hypothetical protein Mapa_005584 [Marchantia paleacea]